MKVFWQQRIQPSTVECCRRLLAVSIIQLRNIFNLTNIRIRRRIVSHTRKFSSRCNSQHYSWKEKQLLSVGFDISNYLQMPIKNIYFFLHILYENSMFLPTAFLLALKHRSPSIISWYVDCSGCTWFSISYHYYNSVLRHSSFPFHEC